MRPIRLILASFILLIPVSALAQEWTEFASREERFTANFPGQPRVTDTTWTSEYGAALKGHIYSGENIAGRYSITVVDYGPVERILTEKAKACPVGAETCRGVADTGIGYWKNDVRGAVVYATSKLLQRPGVKVTHMLWNFMDMVAGQQLQLTNPDGSRTFASIYMHENRLLVMEGTVKAGMPEPGLFQQSLGWLDENGRSVRYSFVYYNDPDLTKPAPRQRTPQQRDDGRIDAPGATGGQAR
jgi:hypothetical protein